MHFLVVHTFFQIKHRMTNQYHLQIQMLLIDLPRMIHDDPGQQALDHIWQELGTDLIRPSRWTAHGLDVFRGLKRWQ